MGSTVLSMMHSAFTVEIEKEGIRFIRGIIEFLLELSDHMVKDMHAPKKNKRGGRPLLLNTTAQECSALYK
jgi:hypothetical protein